MTIWNPESRAEFTVALVTRLAEMVEEAREASAARSRAWRRPGAISSNSTTGAAMSTLSSASTPGPDFGFRRCFAACIKDTLPEKDRLWAVDQVMEIESPEAIKTLQKTLSGLFHPESVKSRRSRDGVTGE
jgi:hypothetical protein